MHDESGLRGWKAIEDDLKAAQEFKERLADVLKADRERATRSRERGRTTRSATREAETASGRRLLGRCSANNQIHCETLDHLESTLNPRLDHGTLIGLASQIVETELDRLLATPALAIAPSLIEALKKKPKDREPAEILEAWAAKKKWTALGIESILLLALRRGCDQGIVPITAFLETHFTPAYQALVRSKPLGRCLDQICVRRNAVIHKGALTDTSGYEDFIRRVVGHSRFALWEHQGPDPTPPGAEVAILHHHLEHSRIAAVFAERADRPRLGGSKPAPDDPAVAKLLALKPKGPPLLDVGIKPLHAGTSRGVRAVTVSAHGPESSFVLGDLIRFRFQTDRPCHVILIDVGTTGETTVLWPNHWHQDTWLDEAGDHFLPAIEDPECDFTLTGLAGTERIVAIASLTPLPMAVLPEPGEKFRSLTSGAVARLVDTLDQHPPGWTLSVCSFAVEQP